MEPPDPSSQVTILGKALLWLHLLNVRTESGGGTDMSLLCQYLSRMDSPTGEDLLALSLLPCCGFLKSCLGIGDLHLWPLRRHIQKSPIPNYRTKAALTPLCSLCNLSEHPLSWSMPHDNSSIKLSAMESTCWQHSCKSLTCCNHAPSCQMQGLIPELLIGQSPTELSPGHLAKQAMHFLGKFSQYSILVFP